MPSKDKVRRARQRQREAERKQRVASALTDPIVFAELYFRPYDPNWSTDIAPFAQQMLDFTSRVKRGVIMLPPEFMKTTICSQVYPLWLTYRYSVSQALLRGMLLSEEEDMAKGNLSVVKWHIENNPKLQADFRDEAGHPLVFPDPEETKWSEDAIIVKRLGTSRDPTWQAKGLDSKGKQGRRLDHIIGDDVVTPKNAWSPTMRKRALDTWELEIETRLVATGQAIACGNFNDAKDLLSTLERRADYRTFRRPSLHRPGHPELPARMRDVDKLHAGDESAAVAQWPEVWPSERLMAELRAKPQRFRRIHLLDARAERGDKLKIDWCRIIQPTDTDLSYCRFYLSLDCAPGGDTEDLDFFTVTVGALGEHTIDVCVSYACRTDTPRQCKLVGAIHDRWQRVGRGVVAIVGARQAMDSYMRGALEVARPDLTSKLEAVGLPGAKLERLEGLGPYAQSGWLRFWEQAFDTRTADAQDQHQELTLAEEWRDFPHGRHDDRLDGVDVLCRAVREFDVMGDYEFSVEVLGA